MSTSMTTVTAAPLAAGAVLAGRYRIARTLGVGAWGRVYLATDTADPAAPQVAIKEMQDAHLGTDEERTEAIAWFKREVSTLLSLEHPSIPRVHGYWTGGQDTGPFYLAMDYVPGPTFERLLADRGPGQPVPWREGASWGIALCDVLAYLHGRTPPFIFRDMKLANVILDQRSGRPVLIDFGIARQLGPSGGTAIGSDGYAPMEQYMGKAEPRSDIYALGATLHALVTGRHPNKAYTGLLRQGKTVEEALHAVFPLAHTLNPDVPVALSDAIARATAFAPEDRFATAVEMRDALAAAHVGRALAAPVPTPPSALPLASLSATPTTMPAPPPTARVAAPFVATPARPAPPSAPDSGVLLAEICFAVVGVVAVAAVAAILVGGVAGVVYWIAHAPVAPAHPTGTGPFGLASGQLMDIFVPFSRLMGVVGLIAGGVAYVCGWRGWGSLVSVGVMGLGMSVLAPAFVSAVS